jgi:ATP-binding cassette subfamily B protein
MLKRLLRHLLAHRLKTAAVLASMLASSGVEMLNPWPLKFVVDNVVGQQPIFDVELDAAQRGLLLILAGLAYVLLAVLRGGLSFARHRWLTEVSQRASLTMRSELYAQVQRLSLRFHDRARVGDMVTRITTDVDKLQSAFMSGLSVLAVDLLTVVGITVSMFLVDWQFGLIGLIVLTPLFVVYAVFRGRMKATSRAVRAGEGAMASIAQEVLSSIRVVKAFGQEEREQQRFVNQTRSQVEANIRAATCEGLFYLLVEVATAAGIGIVLVYGGWRVVRGDLTLGQMLLFLQYLRSLYTPLEGLTGLTSVVQKAGASAERLNELFQAAPEVHEMPNALALQASRGRLTFEHVWFGYEPDRPVLKGIDLEIAAGEVVAIVGPTGVGKSTLVSLIPRFYDPTHGRVLLDGRDLRELRVRSVRDQISIVLQDPILFSGTIRDNIAYGQPGATHSEVVAAAQTAYAHDFIMDLPQGYASPVGERGVTLSGGQRQRIAIARAVLRNTPILILDEPTSAVDRQSESIILKALARLMRGRTVIIITHRPSASRLASRVVGLSDGVIVEVGSPGEPEPDLTPRPLRQASHS